MAGGQTWHQYKPEITFLCKGHCYDTRGQIGRLLVMQPGFMANQATGGKQKSIFLCRWT